jgi:hypothetical protein
MQIINMLPAIMRRARLDRDPFTALHLLKQRNLEPLPYRMSMYIMYNQHRGCKHKAHVLGGVAYHSENNNKILLVCRTY